MVPFEIALMRLESQHIARSEFTSPKSLVAWMGAVQAQDFPMAKWSLGVRLPGSTEEMVASAIDRGEILRTHLLRPTWHFVTPDDIYWLLELTAPQIRSGQRSRDRILELTEAVYSKSNRTIEKALVARGQLSREELILELNTAGIQTDQNRASHLLMRAELDRIICNGAALRGKPMYALLAERVPNPRLKTREEALAELARRYFNSRYPATLPDFTWWSGLPAREARQALEGVKTEFITEEMEGPVFWLPKDYTLPASKQDSVYLLPTYDEFIISYADRRASIPVELEQHMKAISNRGIFWPIIVHNGQVTGTWKRNINKNRLIVELQSFSPLEPHILAIIKRASAQYASFLGKELEIA